VEYVYSRMDRVHGLQLMSLRASLNDGRWLPDRWLRWNQANRYSWSNLHCRSQSRRLGATPARGRHSGRRRNWPAVAAHQSWPYTAFSTSVFDEVFTYGIRAMWRTYFAHLGRTSGNNGGWCGWGGSAQARRRWRLAPGLLQLNRWHQHGRRSSVILLGRLIWHGWRAS
jgi:hypothetical protein